MTTQLNDLAYPAHVWAWLMNNFETDMERFMALKKLELAKAIIGLTQTLIPMMDSARDLQDEFADAGGSFTDQDVEPLGVTATEVADAMNLLNNLSIFMEGGEPFQSTWRPVVNRLRRVQV